MRFERMFFLFLGACLSLLHADELQLDGRKPLKGIFLGISERGKISFQVYGEETPRAFSSAKVTEITLDKPVKVHCFQKRNQKHARAGLFSGMHNGQCRFRFSGENRDQEISLLQISKLDVELDMKHFMIRMQDARRKQAEKIAEKKIAAEEFLVPGRISVLHFTFPELSVNSRQGNLAQRLCEDSSRPAEYVQILIDSLESVLARANALDSLPQFWFYSSEGGLVVKLTGRFTDEDLEQAFRKAGRVH